MHRTIFTHIFFLAQNKINREKIVHTDCTKKIHTEIFARRNFTQNSLYTAVFFSAQKSFRSDWFLTHNNFYRQMVFTQKVLRTEVLRTEGFTHNIFYIQTLLYTDAFTRKTNCTQKLVHTAHFYTQPTFTQRGFVSPS